jgi:integrase
VNAINLFLTELAQEGYSDSTVRLYQYVLLPLKNIDYRTLTAIDIMKLLARDKNINTVATRQTAIKKYFQWLYNTGRINHNPASGLGSVRRPKVIAQPIREDDYKIIAEAINRLPLAQRTLFLLIMETDMNIRQALILNVEDIGESYIEADKTVCFFNPNSKFGESLKELCEHQKQGPLFTNESNERRPYFWAYYNWNKLMKKLNMNYALKQLEPRSKEETTHTRFSGAFF